MKRTFRQKFYHILEQGARGKAALWLHRFFIIIICANIAAVILESIPTFHTNHRRLFIVIEIITLVIFGIEYISRIWSCVESPRYLELGGLFGRIKFMFTPMMVIDFLAIAPLLLDFFVESDIRVVLIFRLIRFFKLARYSTGMSSLVDAIYEERNSLLACLLILFGAVLISASLMHMIEGKVQINNFGTIPDAMYWAMITLTTVGYGDVTPITPLGKLVASLTALCGIVMVALPVGILASAFAKEIHRRDFVVTWAMIARVPLFSHLDAAGITSILKMLKSKNTSPNEIIFRRGDTSDSMYFIAEGKILLRYGHKEKEFFAGESFGQRSVLEKSERMATAISLVKCKLLVLESDDLHNLMKIDDHFKDKIIEMSGR